MNHSYHSALETCRKEGVHIDTQKPMPVAASAEAIILQICSGPGRRVQELLLSRYGGRKHTSGLYTYALSSPPASLPM